MLNLSNIIVSHASKGRLLETNKIMFLVTSDIAIYELKILFMMELIQSQYKIKILPPQKAFRVSHDSGIMFSQGTMSSIRIRVPD